MGQAMVAITAQDCTGCDLCIPHCPFEALLPLLQCPPGFKKRPIIVRDEACVGCLSCIGSCPTDALHEVVIPLSSKKSPLLYPSEHPPTEIVLRWGPEGISWV